MDITATKNHSTTKSTKSTKSTSLTAEELEATGRVIMYYDAIVKCALAESDGIGIPTLAKRVGCSILTCKKHVGRAVQNGTLQQWRGTKGNLYGRRGGCGSDTSGASAVSATVASTISVVDGPWGIKDADVIVRMDGKLTTIAATITAATKSKERVKVVLSGKEHQAVWDNDQKVYIGRGFIVTR